MFMLYMFSGFYKRMDKNGDGVLNYADFDNNG